MRYFCGTSDTSNAAKSSDSSKTSASVTQLSSYSPLGVTFPIMQVVVFPLSASFILLDLSYDLFAQSALSSSACGQQLARMKQQQVTFSCQ